MLFWEENDSNSCYNYCYDGNKEELSLWKCSDPSPSNKMTSADTLITVTDARDEVEMIEKTCDNCFMMDKTNNSDKTSTTHDKRGRQSCLPSPSTRGSSSSSSNTSGGGSSTCSTYLTHCERRLSSWWKPSLATVDEQKPLDDIDENDMVVFIPLRRGNSSTTSRTRFQEIFDQASQCINNSISSSSTSSLPCPDPSDSNTTTLFQLILQSSFGKSFLGRRTIMLLKAPKASLSYLASEDQ